MHTIIFTRNNLSLNFIPVHIQILFYIKHPQSISQSYICFNYTISNLFAFLKVTSQHSIKRIKSHLTLSPRDPKTSIFKFYLASAILTIIVNYIITKLSNKFLLIISNIFTHENSFHSKELNRILTLKIETLHFQSPKASIFKFYPASNKSIIANNQISFNYIQSSLASGHVHPTSFERIIKSRVKWRSTRNSLSPDEKIRARPPKTNAKHKRNSFTRD